MLIYSLMWHATAVIAKCTDRHNGLQ